MNINIYMEVHGIFSKYMLYVSTQSAPTAPSPGHRREPSPEY